MVQWAISKGHIDIMRSRPFNSELFSWHVVGGESGGIQGHLDAPFSGQGVSPAFPAGSGFRCFKQGDPILVDFGTCVDVYIADQTRMFSLGRMEDEFSEAYEILKEIEASILKLTKPGIRCEILYDHGMRMGRELGFEKSFLGTVGNKVKFIGHGVGLEIGEFPYLAQGAYIPAGKK